MKRKRTRDLSSEKVGKLNDGGMHINSLPEEVFVKIFSYIKQSELSRISRVCRKWKAYIWSPILWKKVDLMFLNHHRHKFKATKSIIAKLPSCLTHIKLDFRSRYNWLEPMNFNEFSASLQKCPNLQTIVLYHAELSDTLPSVIDLCTQFLQSIRTLVFRYSLFTDSSTKENYSGISKIEVLDVCGCVLGYSNKPPFSRMPYLKKLYLAHCIQSKSWFENDANFLTRLEVLDVGHTRVDSRTFQTIQHHGHHLKEIYMTSQSGLHDEDLNFNDSTFPYLETISLKNSMYLTCDGIIFLIQSCRCLHHIYVDRVVAEDFATHPFVLANKYLFRNVKVTDISYIKRDYLQE